MTEKRALILQAPDSPNLPPLVKSLSGATFDPRAKRWSFHDGLNSISVNFEKLTEYATETLVKALKFPLIWYAENTEGLTLTVGLNNLKTMLEAVAATQGRPVEPPRILRRLLFPREWSHDEQS